MTEASINTTDQRKNGDGKKGAAGADVTSLADSSKALPPEVPQGQGGSVKHYLIVAGIIGFFLLLGFWFWKAIGIGEGASSFPIAWFIITAAILGSIVNESFRESWQGQPTYEWIATYFAWKCGVSIVFAFLVYLMAIGGLIGGDLFPKFSPVTLSEGETWNMQLFVTKVNPADFKDIAKILVWSFVAGYSEKFVPNLIGKMLKSHEQAKQ